MVWIGAVLGALLGVYTAKRRGGKPLDMAQFGAIFGILFAIIALIINIVIVRQAGG